jgi:hypothetical protein
MEGTMNEKINLKDLQRKAWRSMFQDGLWDIFLGLLLFNMAFGTLLDETTISHGLRIGIYIGVEVLAVLLMFLGKRYITMPRMGTATFGQYGKVKRNRVQLLLFGSFLLGLIAWLVFSGGGDTGVAGISRAYFGAIFWVVNMLVVFGLAGYFLDFSRLYLIGFLYAVSIPLDIFIRKTWQTDVFAFYVFGIPALIILTIGVSLFVRFLRKYPVEPLAG